MYVMDLIFAVLFLIPLVLLLLTGSFSPLLMCFIVFFMALDMVAYYVKAVPMVWERACVVMAGCLVALGVMALVVKENWIVFLGIECMACLSCFMARYTRMSGVLVR